MLGVDISFFPDFFARMQVFSEPMTTTWPLDSGYLLSTTIVRDWSEEMRYLVSVRLLYSSNFGGTLNSVPPKLEERVLSERLRGISISQSNLSQMSWKEDIRCREVRWWSWAPGYDVTAQKSQEKKRND